MEQNKQAFRDGGVYRQRDGTLVLLGVWKHGNPDGTLWAKRVEGHPFGEGFRHMDTGKDYANLSDGARDLIEGELTHIEGKGWVPVTERGEPIETAAAKSIDVLVREHQAALAANAANAATSASAACSKEKLRPALTWNKPTAADRWAGFVTESSTQHQEPQRSFGSFVSPDMQDNGPQVAPGFGSADLIVNS